MASVHLALTALAVGARIVLTGPGCRPVWPRKPAPVRFRSWPQAGRMPRGGFLTLSCGCMLITRLLADGRRLHLRLSHEALTIALGSDRVYTLDHSGRLVGAFRAGSHLRRGLDGRVLARWREDGGPRQRRWLDEVEREQLLAELRADLCRLAAEPWPDDVAALLRAGLTFDYAADVERFHAVYRPVAILPPDQYQALVLQATEGCSFNTCTFCVLYRHVRFHIKSVAEFAHHIRAVKAFFGPGIRLRRSIFLADANALVIPQERLLALLAEVEAAFAIMPADLPPNRRRAWLETHPDGVAGLYAFIDGLSAERKTVADFMALRAHGLRRVYIGLESGHEPLLAWLRKPATAAEMLEAVHHLKAAGLHVGVIVLTGIGGSRFDAGHRRDTAAVLSAMPLDGDDLIYFSPFQPDPDAPYETLAAAAGIEPPDAALAAAQEAAIRRGITLPPPPRGPRRAPYNLRDFVY